MQTQAEHDKFDHILKARISVNYNSNRVPDFEKFAKIWSTIVDGKTFIKNLSTYEATITLGKTSKILLGQKKKLIESHWNHCRKIFVH